MHRVERARVLRDRLGEDLGALDRDPQDVLELGEPDDDGRTRREPDEDGVGQEVDEEAESESAEHQVHDTDDEGERGCRSHVLRRSLSGDRCERRGGEQRRERDRPDGELARRTEDGIHQHRDDGGVEPDLRGQAGEQRVGHGLGHQHGADGEPGDEIAVQIGAPIPGCPPGDRHEAAEQRRRGRHRYECTYF